MKSLFTLVIALLIGFTATAQKVENKIKEAVVPAAVKDAFKVKHPGEVVKQWELDNGKYEADFMKGKAKYTAVFSTEGQWLITGTELKTSAIPKIILDQIKAGAYKDWKVNQARSVETSEIPKEIIVEVEKGMDDVMLYFNGDGKFLREKKE
jgi:predicted methyltransferase